VNHQQAVRGMRVALDVRIHQFAHTEHEPGTDGNRQPAATSTEGVTTEFNRDPDPLKPVDTRPK
jgi:hypothetical protein